MRSFGRCVDSSQLSAARSDRAQTAGCSLWERGEPTITTEQHEELKAILGLPRQRGSNQGTARSYLLTGFVVCGICGAPLRSHRSKSNRETEPQRRYVCDPRAGGGYHVKRLASVVTHFFTRTRWERLFHQIR